MTVELERKFYKWYKRINISCDEQKTTNRWDGIQNAVGLFVVVKLFCNTTT